MTDFQSNADTRQVAGSEPVPNTSQVAPVSAARPGGPLARKRGFFGLGCGGMLSVLLAVLFAAGFGRVMVEKVPIEVVLDKAMTAGKAGDPNAFYALICSDLQTAETLPELGAWMRGPDVRLQFSGYRRLAVTSLNITWSAVTIAEVSGSIEYEGERTGAFEAVLMQEGGEWRLRGIQFAVPVGKPGAVQPAGHP